MAGTEHYHRRTRAQWRALVAGYEASGVSQRAFCERRGVALSTFRYWRARLERTAREERPALPQALQLLPVQIVADPAAGTDSGIVLRAGAGVRIEVASGFDAATLQRVLATLGERA
jgi:hypothetical protein